MRARLEDRLRRLREARRKALTVFLTAGFPEPDSTPRLVRLLVEAGVDIVEIGMPFSDPLADGPVIQRTSAASLANGTTLGGILEDVRVIRKESDIPIILMGYLNPMLRYGRDRFLADAAAAGVDGMILPEVPLEETGDFDGVFEETELARILLVAPGATAERIAAIDTIATGFLYCVSVTGVTGTSFGGTGLDGVAVRFVRETRQAAVKNAVLAGFGISTPSQAVAMAAVADGVIVGSAFLRQIMSGAGAAELNKWIVEFRRAIDGARETG